MWIWPPPGNYSGDGVWPDVRGAPIKVMTVVGTRPEKVRLSRVIGDYAVGDDSANLVRNIPSYTNCVNRRVCLR